MEASIGWLIDQAGLDIAFIPITRIFTSIADIEEYKRAFTMTADPGFGIVNTDGHISDLLEAAQLATLQTELSECTTSSIIVYGAGAAIPELSGFYDLRCYFDKTRQPILWEMWDSKLINR